MLSMYPAYVYKEKEGGYSVIFPDLDHLATCGDTLENALAMAQDCLAGHIYYCNKMGEKINKPSDIADLVNPDDEYDDYEQVFANMITVDVEEYAKIHFEKAIKKTLTIPKWLNDLAISNNINFSKTLQQAIIQELDHTQN